MKHVQVINWFDNVFEEPHSHQQNMFHVSCALYLFTKILKPIFNAWRCKRIPMDIFSWRYFWSGVSNIKAKINSFKVCGHLTWFRFLTNKEKSLWKPVQVITWLGNVFDANQGFISVTEHKISKVKNCKIIKVKDLASVAGQVISRLRFKLPMRKFFRFLYCCWWQLFAMDDVCELLHVVWSL